MLNVIRQWVIKTMMKNNTGVVQTLPKRDLIELNTQITAQRLMQNGVDPQALKNVNQVENAVNAIESRPPVQQGIRSTKSAKVFDLEGKEIKDPKNIMGGKEINQQTLNEELMKKDNPYSDLVNTPRPKTIKEREAEVLAGMEKNNKEAVQRIKNRKMVEEAIDNASPGFAGDRKYDAQLVADDLAEKKFGKDFYDLDQKQQMDLYGEALDGLDDSRFKNKPDPEDMAQGGRAGYMNGTLPMKKDGFFISPDFSKMTPEERELYKLRMERMKKGFEKKLSPEGLEKLKIQQQIREQQRKDRGLPEEIQLMAQGGRAGYKFGIGPLLKRLSQKSPKKAYTDYLESVKKRAQEGDMKSLAPELGAVTATGVFINRRMKDVLENMKEKDMENNLQNFRKELEQDDFYKERPELKDKILENYTEKMFGEKRADGGRAGFANGTGAPSITYDFDKEQEPMGPTFETNDPEEALKEIVRRMINVEPAKIPLSKDMQLMFDLNRAQIGGSKNIGGGELNFGINKGFGRDDTGIGFEFRKQFKDGSGMTRRSFLKILGGLAAIPIVGKFLKPIKTAKGIKSVPIIKTDNVAGKPEWFDALVNKVIIEGDDVTKKFATADRQSIHQKTLDDGSVVRVTEDVDDGAVRVEYDSADNVFEDTVQMEYKKPLPDEGAPNPAAEFTTAESGPVGRQVGPDDFDIDVDEVGGSSIRDLDSDVSKLKQYATGKGPTMEEIVKNKKRRDRAKAISEDPEAQSDAIIRRQGDYDPSDYDDYAAGGIARMLGE